MFRYIQIRSGFFIRFTWILLFALFADTINLDDYLPNSFSIHLDDIDMINREIIDAIIPDSCVNSFTDFQIDLKLNSCRENPPKAVVVLYDLDSLSLAASSSFEKETILKTTHYILQNNVQFIFNKSESSNNIFLQNQSLII